MNNSDFFNYRWDLEKQEGCGMMAHETLTEPRVAMEWLLANQKSFSDLPAFPGLHGIFCYNNANNSWT